MELAKVFNHQTGESRTVAFDANGSPVDPQAEIAGLKKRRQAKYGRLTPTLFNVIAGLKDTDSVPIGVFPVIDFDLNAYEKPKGGKLTGPPPEEVALLKKIGDGHLRALEYLGIKYDKVDQYGLAVQAKPTVAKIKQLATANGIAVLDYNDPETKNCLANSMGVSNASTLRFGTGLNGTGVKTAVWEVGSTDYSNLKYDELYSSKFVAHLKLLRGC